MRTWNNRAFTYLYHEILCGFMYSNIDLLLYPSTSWRRTFDKSFYSKPNGINRRMNVLKVEFVHSSWRHHLIHTYAHTKRSNLFFTYSVLATGFSFVFYFVRFVLEGLHELIQYARVLRTSPSTRRLAPSVKTWFIPIHQSAEAGKWDTTLLLYLL